MHDTTVWKRSTRAVTAEVGDEVIFLHEGEGVYYSLDGVGAVVWKALETPRKFGEIVGLILEEFDVEEEALRQDLVSLASSLTEKGLMDLGSE
jgi:hypothetical protein